MLFVCTDDNKDGNESADKRGTVEINISDFGSYTDSAGDDIVYDFKSPEDKDKVVVTPKQWSENTISIPTLHCGNFFLDTLTLLKKYGIIIL